MSSTADVTVAATGATVDTFSCLNTGPFTQRINGDFGSSARTFASYARLVAASAGGVITIAAASSNNATASAYVVEFVSGPPSGGGGSSNVPLPASGLLALIGFAGIGGLHLSRKDRAA